VCLNAMSLGQPSIVEISVGTVVCGTQCTCAPQEPPQWVKCMAHGANSRIFSLDPVRSRMRILGINEVTVGKIVTGKASRNRAPQLLNQRHATGSTSITYKPRISINFNNGWNLVREPGSRP
jgi:hypothetical protein